MYIIQSLKTGETEVEKRVLFYFWHTSLHFHLSKSVSIEVCFKMRFLKSDMEQHIKTVSSTGLLGPNQSVREILGKL